MISSKVQSKILMPLAMVLTTLVAITIVLGYQVVQVYGYIFSAVALIIPFRHLICDVVAEVYGFYVARKLIIYLICCGVLFSVLASYIIKLPSPTYWVHRDAYNFVLGNTVRITCYASIGVLIGSLLNIYLISKWKVFVKGKFFWLRSLGSSSFGELTQYAVGLTLMFHDFLAWDKVFKLVITDYLLQISILFIFSPIAHIFMFFLKQHEEIRLEKDLRQKQKLII